MEPATQIALELLYDYYGEDFFETPEELVELLKIEFELNMPIEEAKAILNNREMMLDTFINLNTCL